MSRAMLLCELLPDVAGVPRDLEITGLVQDSRQVQPGNAFVAMLPARQEVPSSHGMNFVAQARANGAVAVLYEPPLPAGLQAPEDAILVPGLVARLPAMADAFHGSPSRAMAMVGVTGTSGKTSAVQLLVQAWELLGIRAGSIGTLGAGLHGALQPTGFTTPLLLQTHALLAQLRDAGAEAVAMEVSSHALDQGRVAGVHFDVAGYTNLSRDHLDYHADMDDYAQTKARLFQWPELAGAVINIDDAFGRELLQGLPSDVQGIGCSAAGDSAAEVRASDVHQDAAGLRFTLHIGTHAWPLATPLVGRFNVDNLLLVAGVLHAQGERAEAIVALLPKLQPIAGRMNRLGGEGELPLVVVDYSHKPDALRQALQSLRAHTPGYLVCVFGCGGERDAGKRPEMARIAEEFADRVVVTDDNPRGEDGDAIVAQIVAGFARPQDVIVLRDRAAAIARALELAGEGDSVLVAGKGHETYQEVAGVRHPFDDRDVVRGLLQGREVGA